MLFEFVNTERPLLLHKACPNPSYSEEGLDLL